MHVHLWSEGVSFEYVFLRHVFTCFWFCLFCLFISLFYSCLSFYWTINFLKKEEKKMWSWIGGNMGGDEGGES